MFKHSVIQCSSIHLGIEAVGEIIVASYGKKSYTGTIL